MYGGIGFSQNVRGQLQASALLVSKVTIFRWWELSIVHGSLCVCLNADVWCRLSKQHTASFSCGYRGIIHLLVANLSKLKAVHRETARSINSSNAAVI